MKSWKKFSNLNNMKISGFSYIRNGFKYDYPFLESIQSILPICDEFVIAVGDSNDGTKEAIEKLNSSKIKIIDTIWDDNLRYKGKIFSQQANIALDNITGDWGFHIQADEIIHEKDLDKIKDTILKYYDNKQVEGILFDFLNFWGNYNYIRTLRKIHRYEIRIIRNLKSIRSYKDSQGFRKYLSREDYEKGEKGKKLKVIKINVPVYHYNYVRSPKLMKKKSDYFHRFWHNDEWLKKNKNNKEQFNFNDIDELELFKGTHPKVMNKKTDSQNRKFVFDKTKTKISLKVKILNKIEKLTGWRIGENKNYILLDI